MKFKEKVCGNCGLDLTTVEPVRVREVPIGDEDEMVPYAECPGCHANRVVVAPEPEVTPEPPKPKGIRRRASEPEVVEPAPAPEPAPAEAPEPEE